MSEKHRLDGRAVTVIRAPADQLWTLVSDVTRVGEWSPENVGGMWLDGATAPVVGARFKGTNRRGRTKWATNCEVTAAVPGPEFAFVTGTSAKPQTRWQYLFEPLGDDETRVRNRSSWPSRSDPSPVSSPGSPSAYGIARATWSRTCG